MGDEPSKDLQDPDAETIFNSSIGDDWGEAFEAEDFMASPSNDADTGFFLPEEPTAGPPQAALTPPLKKKAAPASDKSPHRRLTSIGSACTTRFRALPLPLRIAAAAAPILLGLALVFFFPESPAPPTDNQPLPNAPAITHNANTPPPPAPEPRKNQAEPTPTEPEKPPTVSVKPPEKEIRKKWSFPSVIVQAKANKGQDITILSTDLTLVLTLHPEILLPSAKDTFIREMMYQFFSNQPADDLRRFALERGEMTRKLHAWITKQWPGLPLESINIDRYQIL